MHKSFYASGFLYHLPSQQILLQELKDAPTITFGLFCGSNSIGKDPQSVFQQTIEEALGTSFDASLIHPVYDYIHDKLGEHYVFYVDVAGVTPKTYSGKQKTTWVLLSRLSKCMMSEQTRHDIIVGERVIRSLHEVYNPAQHPQQH